MASQSRPSWRVLPPRRRGFAPATPNHDAGSSRRHLVRQAGALSWRRRSRGSRHRRSLSIAFRRNFAAPQPSARFDAPRRQHGSRTRGAPLEDVVEPAREETSSARDRRRRARRASAPFRCGKHLRRAQAVHASHRLAGPAARGAGRPRGARSAAVRPARSAGARDADPREKREPSLSDRIARNPTAVLARDAEAAPSWRRTRQGNERLDRGAEDPGPQLFRSAAPLEAARAPRPCARAPAECLGRPRPLRIWGARRPARDEAGEPIAGARRRASTALDDADPAAFGRDRREGAHWDSATNGTRATSTDRSATELGCGFSATARAGGPSPAIKDAPTPGATEVWWTKARRLWFVVHDGTGRGQEWARRSFQGLGRRRIVPARARDVEMVYSRDFARVAVITPGAGAEVFDAATGEKVADIPEARMPARRRPGTPSGTALRPISLQDKWPGHRSSSDAPPNEFHPASICYPAACAPASSLAMRRFGRRRVRASAQDECEAKGLSRSTTSAATGSSTIRPRGTAARRP